MREEEYDEKENPCQNDCVLRRLRMIARKAKK
jgi:hypothetical protein